MATVRIVLEKLVNSEGLEYMAKYSDVAKNADYNSTEYKNMLSNVIGRWRR